MTENTPLIRTLILFPQVKGLCLFQMITMMKKLIFIFVFFVTISHESCFANNSYEIDFGTPERYVTSLNNIRRELGPPLSNINLSGAQVYELPLQGTGGRNGIVIRFRGVDEYGEGQQLNPRISFVLDPVNLYLAGFIINNYFSTGFQISETLLCPGPGYFR